MRKFKTAGKKRTNYIYYTAEGRKVEITPNEDGMDETWITLLHGMDDEEVNAERRELYHVPVHLESYSSLEDGQVSDHNTYLEDHALSPLEEMIRILEEQEQVDKMSKLQDAIATLQPQQIALIKKVFYDKRSNVDIAAEEGVTEAAIRNRLKKIYSNLQKKMKK